MSETDKRYGMWTTIKYAGKIKDNRRSWLCRCDCGTERIVKLSELKRGKSTSCGHLGNAYKHGMTDTREYKTWQDMTQRCYNSNNSRFHRYGGRGIKVCKRWKNSFENFYADMGECPKNFSLERIDNDGDYDYDNCVWANSIEQARNRSNTIKITYNDETLSLMGWSEKLHINYGTLKSRLYNGWSVERAFTS